MFYLLLETCFGDLTKETALRVFGYTTVRAACAMALAFLVSLLLGPTCIRRLAALKVGQQVREFRTSGTEQFNIHQHKAGTPTMGGLLIIIATLLPVVLFCNPANSYVWAVAAVMLGAGSLGFADDFLKVRRRNHRGVSVLAKLTVQVALGCLLGVFLYFIRDSGTYYAHLKVAGAHHLLVPFLKNLYPDLGLCIILWAAFVLTATSNAVNLTDGLDGLAIGAVTIASLPYIAIAYLASRFDYAKFLYIAHVPQAGDLGVFLCALVGAGMGFLWFNSHPAEVFMGDTGSLSLGAAIGAVAILCKQELLLVLIGAIFVIEALSVLLQVGSYKWRGKRVFLMSPLHNHFVKKGWHESKIIARFLIVATLLALAGLSTLKLR